MMQVIGGICYAHGEYEGQNCPRWPDCANEPHKAEFVALGERRINAPKEHARLEQEVIRAAKELRKASKNGYVMPTAEYHKVVDGFNAAADALIEFENQPPTS